MSDIDDQREGLPATVYYTPPPYGEREPCNYDIEAIAKYLEAIRGYVSPQEREKAIDRAQTVFETYVEQFRKPENG